VRARDLALGADIHGTARTAERVVAMLDAPATGVTQSIRLMLF
jgi:hypothetical protein